MFLPEASFGLRVLSLPVSVCVCVYQSLACPHDNSSPVQARITKFGPENQNTLVKIPIAVLWISPNSWVAHRSTHGGKLGRPNHCLVARIILTSLLKTFFLVINTKFACFLFDQVPTYRELGRPSGDSGGHVGSPDRVMHRAVSGEGITYYPRQNGSDREADWNGFVSNCTVYYVHTLAIVTHVISNNATRGVNT